jgi:hypothetical protein
MYIKINKYYNSIFILLSLENTKCINDKNNIIDNIANNEISNVNKDARY